MRELRWVDLLPLLTVLVWGPAIAQDQPSPNTPDALVRRFYEQVVARHPLGMPYGADMKAFAPYLSKGLRHRMDLSVACFADWHRQNPDTNLKPPSAVLEAGLFSGPSEEAEPKAFHIEKTEPGKGGSYRVTVRLTWEDPSNRPHYWYVAAVVVPEQRRLVVDDVIYVKHMGGDAGSRLSEVLSFGCAGARWIGSVRHRH